MRKLRETRPKVYDALLTVLGMKKRERDAALLLLRVQAQAYSPHKRRGT